MAYLGHADPGFTLRVYTHLMPASEERTRNAIDTLLAMRCEQMRPRWPLPHAVRLPNFVVGVG
ncbi:hypothetical protein [Micromonospora saelicesensis]|uniref:hypothetical protein n=1 Tax=Micromonospora saelicesensis TaxID=285676 RepID=UPI000DC60304|nr:hypothetical protein [Micromonospora saelicesensis]RAO62887.1 hypothetical protein PSN01_00873 [Micromonospora saelicesensis]